MAATHFLTEFGANIFILRFPEFQFLRTPPCLIFTVKFYTLWHYRMVCCISAQIYFKIF